MISRVKSASRTAAWLAPALLLAPGWAQAGQTPAAATYILAGQSNMSGRGALDALLPEERLPDPAIRLYGNDGQWHAALDPVDSAQGQIDEVSADKIAAVGPGLSFARRMLVLGGRPVNLVPCAKGGTSIARWAPAAGRDTLYGSCLARAREAGGKIAGILWYQGETDGEKPPEEAARWGAAFTDLVAAFRRDLGEPALPLVFVQIANQPARPEDAGHYPGWAAVQQAQAQISLPCTGMVSAAGLSRNPDQMHLDTAAQRSLGVSLAEAMASLQAQKACSAAKR